MIHADSAGLQDGLARRLASGRGFALALAALLFCGCPQPATPPGAGVPWTNYPHLYNSPAATYDWLLLECQISDVPAIPAGLDLNARQFFGNAGVGYGNLVDYFSDVSYGDALVYAGGVVGWTTAPFNFADVTAKGGRLSGPQFRAEQVKECLNAVPPRLLPDLSRYYGVLMVTNAITGTGACYDGQQTMTVNKQDFSLGCVTFDPGGLFTDIGAHEVGHGLGLVHSFDTDHGEYGDPWDIMSALQTYQFKGPNFPGPGQNAWDGPGMDVPNLLERGWIPNSRIATYTVGDPTITISLRALSHPIGVEPLAVEIVDPNNPSRIYTLEYRQADGWDAGFGILSAPGPVQAQGGAVFLHDYEPNGSPWSILQDNANRGALLVGDTVGAGAFPTTLQVIAIDTKDSRASVTLSPIGRIIRGG